MGCIRIIPRIDIKGPNLVKGVHLEGLRVLGKPEEFARYYYENGADELIYMDVVASLYDRNSLHDIISRTAKEIFIPLTVGGGIRSTTDIKSVLRAGADKVSINTAAVKNPQLIKDAVKMFGSSTIIVSIEAIKQADGTYLAFMDNGREHTGLEVVKWAKKIEELGVGEIMITSVDNEGTGCGYDIELIKMITDEVSLSVVANGGPGQLKDIKEVVLKGNVNAVSIASMLHYNYLNLNKSIIESESEGNKEFLKSGNSFSKIQSATILEIKNYMTEYNINCRI